MRGNTRSFRPTARRLGLLGCATTLLVSQPSLGVPAPAGDRPPPRAVDPSIPSAARGFQAALRTGAQLPWGDASDAQGDELSARYAWQLPLIVDAGFKIGKPLFLGAYAGVGYGRVGSSSEAKAACEAEGVDCLTLSYQLGVQGQYHFRPSDAFNPWIGYGLGYEAFRQSLSSSSYTEEQESTGVALLKLSVGLDYRSTLGFGPFVEVSAGRFQATRTVVDGAEVHEGPVEPGAWHGFLTIGVRLVVLP